MFKITSNKIKISRGDAATANLTISGYTLLSTDVVKMAVFEKNSGFDDALVTLTATIDTTNNVAVFTITETTTSFADASSEKQTFWYEVKLNGDQTVIGFDDDGPKEFIVYPAEVGDTNA